MGGPMERPLKCPHDKTVLETTLRGARCSQCDRYFQTKWEDIVNPETGAEEHTQLLVEIMYA